MDLHFGLEDAGLYRDRAAPGGFHEVVVQGLRFGRRCGPIETGALAFATISIKSKLRNHQ